MIEWWDETCGDLVHLDGKGCDNPSSLRRRQMDVGPRRNGYDALKTTLWGGISASNILARCPKPNFVMARKQYRRTTTLAAAGLASQISRSGPQSARLHVVRIENSRDAIFGESFADISDIEDPEATCADGVSRKMETVTYDGEVNRYSHSPP